MTRPDVISVASGCGVECVVLWHAIGHRKDWIDVNVSGHGVKMWPTYG